MTNTRKFTARELLMDGNEGHSFRDVIDNLDEADIIEVIQEYAKMKCKELLEIVAEKAVLVLNGEIYSKTYSVKVYNERIKLSIDKDSILNAVDLETFII